MLVTGRFGLKTYDLSNPGKPKFLDEITAEELRLPGDPPYSPSNPTSTFWQNEDMDVDHKRKLALLSRDPRAYRGSTSRAPGEPDPNGATNIAGVYVVDAKNPADLKLLSFEELPTGHTTTASTTASGCGPAARPRPPSRSRRAGSAAARSSSPTCATRRTRSATRRSRSTCSARTASPPTRTTSTSTTPASPGSPASAARAATTPRACTGTRCSASRAGRRRWTRSRTRAAACRRRPRARSSTPASRSSPLPDGNAGGWMHNSWRPIGSDAPRPTGATTGELLLGTEEWFGAGTNACRDEGKFTISSLKGSYNGEGWRSTPDEAVPHGGRRLVGPGRQRGHDRTPSAPARRTTST